MARERIEKLRGLLKSMERALGEENVGTLEMLNQLGCELDENGEYEEMKEVWESCLAGRTKVLGEDHTLTLMTVGTLGNVYAILGNYEKALEFLRESFGGTRKDVGEESS